MMIRKASVYALGEFSNRIGKALAIFLLAYLLAKEQYGIYNYILASSGVLVALLDAGVNTLVILRASMQRFGKLFALFALSKLVAVVVVVTGFFLLNLVTPILDNVDAAIVVPLVLLSLSLDSQAFVSNALRARFDYMGDALVKLIASAGFLVLLVALILGGVQLNAVNALWAQATMIGLAVGFGAWRIWVARAELCSPRSHSARGVRTVLAISLPFAISSFGASFFNTIDTLVLGSLSEFNASATFSLVHRIGLMTQLPIVILIGCVLPYLTAQFGKSQAKPPDRQLVDWTILLAALAGLVMGQVFVLGVENILVPLLGAPYAEAAHVAATLSLYVVPIYVYPIVTIILTAKRFILSPSLFFAAATLSSAGLDYVVISRFAPLDVAWVSAFSNWLLMCALCALYRHRIGEWPLRPRTAALIAAAGVCMLALNQLDPGSMNSLIRALLLLGSFAAATTLLQQKRLLQTAMSRAAA
jgi:O-antigen/teichoic acid export membrane protein